MSKEIWLGPLLGNNRSRLIEHCSQLASKGQVNKFLYLAASHPLLEIVTQGILDGEKNRGVWGELPVYLFRGLVRRILSNAIDDSGQTLAPRVPADQDELRQRRDANGIALPDALRDHGVDLDRALEARKQLESAVAYLELHIEQGPVLEAMDLPLGVVLGTFWVERHQITWKGQAAHAGSTPMDKRRDALAGAAKLALEIRPIAAEVGAGAVCTSGGVVCKPGIVTSVVETAEQLLDQRHLNADSLARLLSLAKAASERFAAEENIEVSWERIWSIEPILFDDALIELAEQSIREVSGTAHRLPSGPLHDAAEVARAGVPTVMVFVQSLRGLSHTKLEDTRKEHLEMSVEALDRLTSKTLERLS